MNKINIIDDCIASIACGTDDCISEAVDLSHFFAMLANDLDNQSPVYGTLYVKRATILRRLKATRKLIKLKEQEA